MRIAKLPYYASASWALARQMTPSRGFLHAIVSPPATVSLGAGLTFAVHDRLGLLILKETVIDDAYGLRAVPADASTIVDVGAGFGDFAVFAAHLFPRAGVLALEPEPHSFASLERTIALSGAHRVEARRLAVGTSRSYRLVRGRRGLSHTAPAAQGDIEAGRLDELLPPGPVDLLKIDCEGAEDDVLASCSPEAMARVRRVVLEYHRGPSQAKELATALSTHGLRIRVRPDRYDPDIGYLDGTRD